MVFGRIREAMGIKILKSPGSTEGSKGSLHGIAVCNLGREQMELQGEGFRMNEIYRELDHLFDGNVPKEVADLAEKYEKVSALVIGRGKEISKLKSIIQRHVRPSRLNSEEATILAHLGVELE